MAEETEVLEKENKVENPESEKGKFDFKAWENPDTGTEVETKENDDDDADQEGDVQQKKPVNKVKKPEAKKEDVADEDSALKDKSPKDKSSTDDPESTKGILAKADDEDNDFTLDEDEQQKDGEKKPTDKKDTDTEAGLMARLGKEFGIDQVPQDPEQLISALKEKFNHASASASAPTQKHDEYLALPDRDLVKANLMLADGLSDEDAEAAINFHVDKDGEEWLKIAANPIRGKIRKSRSDVVANHVKAQEDKAKLESAFTDSVRSKLKETKTFLDIPLKQYQAELREIQAEINTPEKLAKLRSDPEVLIAGVLALRQGRRIVEDRVKEKNTQAFGKGWETSYTQNVEDKLLNKGSGSRNGNPVPNKGTKEGGKFDINAYNNPGQ